MKATLWIVGVYVITASTTFAGGIERSGDPTRILFEEGKNYLEITANIVSPKVSGVPLAGVPGGPTGNVFNDYQTYSFGYKWELSNRASLAFVIDEPGGASLAYSDLLAFFAGSEAEVSSIAYTGMAKYQVTNRVSVYGGVRVIGVEGDITIASPITVSSPYNLNVSRDYQVGYLAGLAYEIPDIAMRVAATYESKTEHEFDDNAGAPFQVEIPQAVTFYAQTGLATNTVLFGSARWREWSNFTVQPADFLTIIPGVGPVNAPIANGNNDTWTYEFTIAHRFAEQWSGAAAIGYERGHGETVDDLTGADGYISYGLAVSYETQDWKLSTGVRYVDIGSANSSVTAFSENYATSVGVKVSRKF